MIEHHTFYARLTHDGAEHCFSYRTCGHGPDLLLLHGWLSSSRLWEGPMRFLARPFRCVALDMAGFGESRRGDGPLSVEDQTRFARQFCETIGLRPHAVIGHSMGGAVALRLALEHADLFDKLVLICPVVTGRFSSATRLFISTVLHYRAFAIGQRIWPKLQALPSTLSVLRHPYLSRQVARRQFEDFRKATWGAVQGGAVSMLDIGLERRLTEIVKPTFVVISGRDETVPPNDGRIAAALIPNAESIEFPTGHHHIFDEDPGRFNEALGHFLGVHVPDHVKQARHHQADHVRTA